MTRFVMKQQHYHATRTSTTQQLLPIIMIVAALFVASISVTVVHGFSSSSSSSSSSYKMKIPTSYQTTATTTPLFFQNRQQQSHIFINNSVKETKPTMLFTTKELLFMNTPTKNVSTDTMNGESIEVRQQQQQKVGELQQLSNVVLTKQKRIVKSMIKTLVLVSVVCLLQIGTTSAPAVAAAAKGSTAAAAATGVVEHLHTGQKIANFFRTFGIPDYGILTILSALPVVELRGAIPVGIWMGLPITTVLPLCICGNMLPIIPILLFLKNQTIQKMMKPILDRAAKKTSELGIGSPKKQWISLAAFVGVPLPGTGAWTGAMGAFLLNMPFTNAISSIFAGVVSAGCIMSAITLAGKKGGLIALGILLLITAQELLKKKKED